MTELHEQMIDVFAHMHTACANCEDCPIEQDCNADPAPYTAERCREAITEHVRTVARGLIAARGLVQ